MTIADGTATATIDVIVSDDALLEGSETVVVTVDSTSLPASLLRFLSVIQ